MNPLSLRLQNFGVFRDETITLPEGLVGILGELRNSPSAADSNGAGKSTLISAIVAALFGVEPGRPKGSQTFAPDVTYGEDRMEIELTFSQGDDLYRVRRTFTKSGTKVDFEVCRPLGAHDEAEHWEGITRESIDATQSLIDRTIGFTRSMFIASALFTQKGETFPTGKKAMELLAEAAFGLEPSWPVYAKRAADERKAFEIELQQLEGRSQAARELVATKAGLEREHEDAVESETVAADVVADREREHVALAERWQAAREQAGLRAAAEAELASARGELDRLQKLDVAATEAVLAIGQTREALTVLPAATETDRLESRITELEAAVETHRKAAQAHERAVEQLKSADRERADLGVRADAFKAKADALTAQIAHIEEGALDNCPMCKQMLGADARAETIESLTTQALAAIDAATALREQATAIVVPVVPAAPEGEAPTEELGAARDQYRAAQEVSSTRGKLEERIVNLQRDVDARPQPENIAGALATTKQAVEKVNALTPIDLAAIEAEGRTAKSKLDGAKTILDSARSLRARLDERLNQMTTAEQALAEAATKQAELHRSIDTRVRLEKACGLNGVRTLILETAVIPFMEAQTAAALTALGTPWQVELRTQREQKNGNLADTLDIVVQTESGETPYWKLSGGEEMRVAVALRCALNRLNPGRSDLFVIDEPRWIDQAGTEALIESLRGLLGEFSRVYCVTQSGTALRDSFDTCITVIKDGGSSRVLDGYAVEAEAVAA